jgi:hypothetical protein
MANLLADVDRQVVDTLLDWSVTPSTTTKTGFVRPAGGDFDLRLQRLENLLGLLRHLPEPELPDGLVSRTLRKIEQTAPPVRADLNTGFTRPHQSD